MVIDMYLAPPDTSGRAQVAKKHPPLPPLCSVLWWVCAHHDLVLIPSGGTLMQPDVYVPPLRAKDTFTA